MLPHQCIERGAASRNKLLSSVHKVWRTVNLIMRLWWRFTVTIFIHFNLQYYYRLPLDNRHPRLIKTRLLSIQSYKSSKYHTAHKRWPSNRYKWIINNSVRISLSFVDTFSLERCFFLHGNTKLIFYQTDY